MSDIAPHLRKEVEADLQRAIRKANAYGRAAESLPGYIDWDKAAPDAPRIGSFAEDFPEDHAANADPPKGENAR